MIDMYHHISNYEVILDCFEILFEISFENLGWV